MRHRELSFLLGSRFHRLAWTDWGDEAGPVVVCVHGLTGTGRDFDPLAAALAGHVRVVCPDLPGRGASDWLAEPGDYNPASYLQALSHLFAAIGASAARPVGWVGTSLGGILGMMVGAGQGQPIARLVLNDVGPHVPAAALARIRAYMATVPPAFADLAALEVYLRQVHAPFGPLTPAQWAHLAATRARVLPDGRVAMHYDPAIALPVAGSPLADVDLWPLWARVTVPSMVVRGAESDLLDAVTAERMRADGARLLEVADAGHAPALMDAATIAGVLGFLLGPAIPVAGAPPRPRNKSAPRPLPRA